MLTRCILGVKRQALNLLQRAKNPVHGLYNNLWRIASLRKAIKTAAPDVVVSFIHETNVLVLLACSGLRIPVVISERVDPLLHRVGWVWRVLRRVSYSRANALVVQTDAVVERFPQQLRRRISVIPNPIVMPCGARPKKKTSQRVGIGRHGTIGETEGF